MTDQAPVVLQAKVNKSRSLGVIGVNLGMNHNVRIVREGCPATGVLQVGDKIVKSIDLEGRKEITGRPDTLVSLIVKREGSPPLVIILRRQAYQTVGDPTTKSYFKGREDFVIGDED
jgi:hypothetical protein